MDNLAETPNSEFGPDVVTAGGAAWRADALPPLCQLIHRAEVFLGQFRHDDARVSHLRRYVAILRDDIGGDQPLAALISATLARLIALARRPIDLERQRGVGRPSRAGSPRAARLEAIKADIRENFDRSDLTIDVVATRHGITPRYVQMLFDADGKTFSEFLLGERLQRAHRLLRNPDVADRTITDIAFEVGFNDLSYFNRTFRRRFAATPTQVRGAASR